MNEEQVITAIGSALKDENPSKRVSVVCRYYLKEEIKSANMRDLILEKHLCDIADHFEVSLEYEQRIPSETEVKKPRLDRTSLFGLGLVVLGGAFVLASDNTVLRSLGCIAVVSGGFLTGKSLHGAVQKVPETKLFVKSTAEDVFRQLSRFANSLEWFFKHSSLETCDKEILRWLQEQYSKSMNEEYKESIADLLDKCYYEFCPYSLDIADFFDVTYGNVEDNQTTFFSVKNARTGDYVLRGHVVLPRK